MSSRSRAFDLTDRLTRVEASAEWARADKAARLAVPSSQAAVEATVASILTAGGLSAPQPVRTEPRDVEEAVAAILTAGGLSAPQLVRTHPGDVEAIVASILDVHALLVAH